MSKNERATGGRRGRSSRRGGCAPGAHGHSGGGGGRVRVVLGVAGSSGPSCAVERCEPIDEKLRACVSTDRPVTRRRRRGGVPVPVPVCAASEEAVTEPAGSVTGAEEVLVRGEGPSVSTWSKCAVRVGVEGTLPSSAVLSVAGRLREGESGRSGVSPSVSGSDAASCARRIAVIFFFSPR